MDAPAARFVREPEPATATRESVTALMDRACRATDLAERRRLQDEVVVRNLGVARSIAALYRGRGIAQDDLEQVACLALVKAVRGYDGAHQAGLMAYAAPTIRGELRKHFRDAGWMVRPPRRIQELQTRITAAGNDFGLRTGSSPRPSEIAAALHVSVEDVTEALAADGCFRPESLDRDVGSGQGTPLGALLRDDTDDLASAEARVMLAPAVRRLPQPDRRMVQLRFFRGWTYREIGRELGMTPLQVSRRLGKVLGLLRHELS